MEKYSDPKIKIIGIQTDDVITTSSGTETGRYDEVNGIWEQA